MKKILNIKSKIHNYNIYSENKFEKIFKDLPKIITLQMIGFMIYF